MKIERPDWVEMSLSSNKTFVEIVDAWFSRYVEPVNKMLSEGLEVYGCKVRRIKPEESGWAFDENYQNEETTHKALLIGITEIKEDTVEDILKEYIENSEDKWPVEEYERWRTRAKKLLEKK